MPNEYTTEQIKMLTGRSTLTDTTLMLINKNKSITQLSLNILETGNQELIHKYTGRAISYQNFDNSLFREMLADYTAELIKQTKKIKHNHD